MKDLELLSSFTDEVPDGLVSATARQRLHAAIAAEADRSGALRAAGRTPRQRPAAGARRRHVQPGRLVMAAGLSVAVAAAAVAAVTLTAPHPHGRSHAPLTGRQPLTATDLAYRAAAAAQRGPAASPGQWLYDTEQTTWPGQRSVTFWRTAGAAYQRTWCYQVPKGPFPLKHPRRWRCTEPLIQMAQLKAGQLVRSSFGVKGPLRAFRSGLPSSLPADPHALLSYLAAHAHAFGQYLFEPAAPGIIGGTIVLPGKVTTAAAEFNAVGFLLSTYVMSPGLTAELYRALGDIRGVQVDSDARDVAGRPGDAFSIAAPDSVGLEIFLNPGSYAFDGISWVQPGSATSGVAIVAQTPVSGPGVQP